MKGLRTEETNERNKKEWRKEWIHEPINIQSKEKRNILSKEWRNEWKWTYIWQSKEWKWTYIGQGLRSSRIPPVVVSRVRHCC